MVFARGWREGRMRSLMGIRIRIGIPMGIGFSFIR